MRFADDRVLGEAEAAADLRRRQTLAPQLPQLIDTFLRPNAFHAPRSCVSVALQLLDTVSRFLHPANAIREKIARESEKISQHGERENEPVALLKNFSN
jgi:hypothetical protein